MLGATFRRDNDDDELRAIQATAWGSWGDEGGSTWSGANVTSSNATQLLTVYGCVRLISDSISTLPVDVFRTVRGEPQEMPRPTWLDFPMPGLHRVSWLTQVISSLLLDGNAYIAVLFREGKVEALVPLDASRVSVKWEEGRRVVYVDGTPTRNYILHIPGLMLAGSDIGLSPVEAARQSIGAGMAVQEFAARFFGQGAVMSGVIESPNALTPDVAKRMASSFAKKHSGRKQAHLPAVLEGGATWRTTGVTNEQAQFLETRGFTAGEIAGQMFLLDPSDLGIPYQGSGGNLTYANLEQRNQRRVQVALLPWIVRIEMALGTLLPAPRYLKFNVSALLRADAKTRMETHVAAVQGGINTANERRALEEQPPLPGGDVLYPPAGVGAAAGTDPEPESEAPADDEPRTLHMVRNDQGLIDRVEIA